jgi:hypothetical protein
VLAAHITQPPPRLFRRLPDLPPAFDDMLARGMAKDPSERYASCTALIEAARGVLGRQEQVFISYARADHAFVRSLHEGLRTRGRQTWVDWEAIPPSAEWMAEIRAAIDAADAFVFVILPDSQESGARREELAHAEAAHKRIVPVLDRDAGGIPIPDSLAKRNWVLLREGDDLDESLRTLLQVVETDLEWIRYHVPRSADSVPGAVERGSLTSRNGLVCWAHSSGASRLSGRQLPNRRQRQRVESIERAQPVSQIGSLRSQRSRTRGLTCGNGYLCDSLDVLLNHASADSRLHCFREHPASRDRCRHLHVAGSPKLVPAQQDPRSALTTDWISTRYTSCR